jgi:hypothetical protein
LLYLVTAADNQLYHIAAADKLCNYAAAAAADNHCYTLLLLLIISFTILLLLIITQGLHST